MKLIQLLVIEDNAAEAYLVMYALEDSPRPVRFHRAKDAIEGLQMLGEQCDPTVVPVVMFSVSSNPADAERALALGAREFVHKPVGLEAYRHAVLTMIEKWVLGTGKKIAGV
jgi:CheY-like chemotaxis protein